MKLVIQPGKEAEWTLPLLSEPSRYLGETIPTEFQECHNAAAFAEHIRSIVEMLARNDSNEFRTDFTLKRIDDIFTATDKSRAIDDLIRSFQESDLKFLFTKPEEVVQFKLQMHLIPTPEFYVAPLKDDGTPSNKREIAYSKRLDLIQRIKEDLPSGYGISVLYPGPNNLVGGIFDTPRIEPVDLELRAKTSDDILRVGAVFANGRRYDNAYLFMENNPQPLARQAFYLTRLRKAGHAVTVDDYSKIFTIPIEQAQKEVRQMAALNLVKLNG